MHSPLLASFKSFESVNGLSVHPIRNTHTPDRARAEAASLARALASPSQDRRSTHTHDEAGRSHRIDRAMARPSLTLIRLGVLLQLASALVARPSSGGITHRPRLRPPSLPTGQPRTPIDDSVRPWLHTPSLPLRPISPLVQTQATSSSDAGSDGGPAPRRRRSVRAALGCLLRTVLYKHLLVTGTLAAIALAAANPAVRPLLDGSDGE